MILLFSVKGIIERVEDNEETKKRSSEKVENTKKTLILISSFLCLADENGEIHRSTFG